MNIEFFKKLADRKRLSTGLHFLVVHTTPSCTCMDIMSLVKYNSLIDKKDIKILYSTKKDLSL